MERKSEDIPLLVAQEGLLNGQRWALRGRLIIGRDASCDIVVADRQVSRRHARITPTSNGILLEDLGSKNGTNRNGEVLTDPVILLDGDSIQIALAQTFLYLSSDATLPLDGELVYPSSVRPGRLRVDKRSHRVWISDQEVTPPLSMSQFKMLELLYEHQGRVVSRQQLIEVVWGTEEAIQVTEQALDAMVRRLRERLADTDKTHEYIVTVRGHGLRLDNPEDE
jgi:pSer/pThr/pTyr-binding forkhead associated (FHA) protein